VKVQSSFWPHLNTHDSGRLREDTINPRLYRHWLQPCRRNHGSACWTESRPTLKGLRVIDIQDMAVRLAPDFCKYAVLSYCWGGAKTTLLMKDTVHILAQAQSLSTNILPNTIVDAIDVTRNAGVRYLWVDALCIVQDDPVMLQSHIPQMARIQEQGIFTIVAAAADNADNGLAGVRPGTRTIIKDMITLHNLSLIVAPVPPHLDHGEQMVLDVRGHSRFGAFRWRSRAWTLQEELFSRRRLYFGADRLLWQCPCGLYQEETVKEVPAACVSNHQRGELLDIDPWLTSTIMDIHFDFVLYDQLGLVPYSCINTLDLS
jgi:hypothetical protein